MSNFSELSDYKSNIILNIISSPNLVKAIYNTDSDFINQSLPVDFDVTSLIYSQIYPYSYVPSTTTQATTFITMRFGDFKYINNVFKSGILTFYIMVHHSLMSTDYRLRTDYILNQIDLLFNKKSDVGFFNLELYSGGDFVVNENYYGMSISYKFTDFNR